MNDQIMIVTGTSRGVGRKVAEYYLSTGWQVIGCSRDDSDSIKHINYKHFSIDISKEEDIHFLFKNIKKTYKRLDVLINNAAISSENYVMSLKAEEIDNTFKVNTQASMLIAKEAHRAMRKSKFGRIINISSLHANICCPGASVYGASKAALEQFSRIMAREVIFDRVTVNTLSLSVVEESGMLDSINMEIVEKILDLTITKEKLKLLDITHAIDFLISPNARLITGETLHIGGI